MQPTTAQRLTCRGIHNRARLARDVLKGERSVWWAITLARRL